MYVKWHNTASCCIKDTVQKLKLHKKKHALVHKEEVTKTLKNSGRGVLF